jgi:hypothetical protein
MADNAGLIGRHEGGPSANEGSCDAMKFGIRKPSLKRSLSARTSIRRMARHNLGLKAPKGMGWLTDPEKAAYNRVYNRTSVSFWSLLKKLFR